jgi:membrane-associated phospholipid phosphatase
VVRLRWADPGAAGHDRVGRADRQPGRVLLRGRHPVVHQLGLLYVMAGLVVSSLGSGVRWKRLLLDWLPLIVVLFGYGILRGLRLAHLWGPVRRSATAGLVRHPRRGFSVDPTVQLQRWLYRPGLHFWDYLVWACYMSHFFASFIIAGVLWKTNYPSSAATSPVRGPDLHRLHHLRALPGHAPLDGQPVRAHAPTTRIIDQVWKHLHIGLGQALFAGGNKFDNNVAAMPSLHGAYPMLICLFFWKGSSRRKRVLLAAYPICMAFSLVYTGEHFVIDIFVGWIYAAATVYFGSKLLNRWEARRLRKQAPPVRGSGQAAPLDSPSRTCRSSPRADGVRPSG